MSYSSQFMKFEVERAVKFYQHYEHRVYIERWIAAGFTCQRCSTEQERYGFHNLERYRKYYYMRWLRGKNHCLDFFNHM